LLIQSGNDPYNVPDDEDILTGYGRRREEKINGVKNDDIELSDYVKFRLFLARQLALAKYQEAHG
jgi:hypothetical protein